MARGSDTELIFPVPVRAARRVRTLGPAIGKAPWLVPPLDGILQLGTMFSMALLIPCLLLMTDAVDRFYGTPWSATPATGLALMAAAAVLSVAGAALLWVQWRDAPSYRRPATVHASVAAVACMWGGYLGLLGHMARLYVPYGLDLLSVVEEERVRPGIQLSPDGTTLAMRMGFEVGVADRVKSFLKGHPGVRTVELSGPGGYVTEARALASLIRERGLDTRVQDWCASACAVAFVAGRNRSLLSHPAKSYVGFYPTSTRDADGNRVKSDSPALFETFRAYGVSDAFAWRVQRTPVRELWHPDPAELWAGGVPVTVLGPYDVPGRLWGSLALTPAEAAYRADPRGEVVGVLRLREPDVLDSALAWAGRARARARNERMVTDRVDEAIGRVLALRIALAPDAEVVRAAGYVRAAMVAVRPSSGADCARLGDRPNLLVAARRQPGPPGAASDPLRPYGALLDRAYAGRRHAGWPEGIALPDEADDETWSRRGPAPRPPGTCAETLAWYDDAIKDAAGGGAHAIRARFAAFARTPVLTGTGRAVRRSVSAAP